MLAALAGTTPGQPVFFTLIKLGGPLARQLGPLWESHQQRVNHGSGSVFLKQFGASAAPGKTPSLFYTRDSGLEYGPGQ